jgi:hypothetical protein
MIDKKWHDQARKENRLPVNRLALKFLKQKGQRLNPQNLWSLQFLVWALDPGLVSLNDLLEQSLGNLLSWPLRQASNYLELKGLSVKNLNEKDLAWLLANQLDQAMSESVKGYPPLPPGSYR